MPGLLDEKVGLVTGAAGGIGRATAIACAREGAAVVASDLAQAQADGEETVRLIAEQSGRALFVACDVATAADQEALVAEAVESFGRLDFAHNNAGIEAQGPLTEIEEAEFDRVIAVNLRGVWLGMKYQLLQMVRQGSGAIVNTSSLAGLVGSPGLGAYVASKHGVVGLTKTAAVEYAEQEIRINAVCPAAIRTPMMDRLEPEVQEELMAPQAIKRFGETNEVAEAVVWLCSDRSSFVTGVAMPVDAGATAF